MFVLTQEHVKQCKTMLLFLCDGTSLPTLHYIKWLT